MTWSTRWARPWSRPRFRPGSTEAGDERDAWLHRVAAGLTGHRRGPGWRDRSADRGDLPAGGAGGPQGQRREWLPDLRPGLRGAGVRAGVAETGQPARLA